VPGASRHTLLLSALPQRHDAALTAWIDEALRDEHRVVVKHRSQAEAALRRLLHESGWDRTLVDSGRIVLADAARLGAQAGGRRELLAELHSDLLAQALADGYAGLAMTGDAPALQTLTADVGELAAHERDIEQLTTHGPVRALCRYHPIRDAALLLDQLAIHRCDIDDDGWTATGSGHRWWISGELDAENADRLRRVLCAAIPDGLGVVDVSALEFCDVAGLRAFRDAADTLPAGREFVLIGATSPVAQIFTVTGREHCPRLRLLHRSDQR